MRNILHKSVLRLSLLVSVLSILFLVVSCAPLTDGEAKGALAGQAFGTLCGNLKTDLGEECDDGNSLEDDFCTSQCKFTYKVSKIKVRVVKTCMADGILCSNDLKQSYIQVRLNEANDIYARSLSKIRFIIDPATSYDFVKDDLIASRYVFSKPVSEIEMIQEKDINKDGLWNDYDLKTIILYDDIKTGYARSNFASQYPGSLVVFALANQNLEPEYSNSAGHWIVDKATGGFSSCYSQYIAMPPSLSDGNLFAHESGHFFCTDHTFGSNRPKTIEEAANTIKYNINSKGLDPNNNAAIQNILDGDFPLGILDTPADPGTSLFTNVIGEKCDPDLSKKIEVPVTLNSGAKVTYAFKPDRTNIMSYFKTCFPNLAHFSPGQVAKHYETLQTAKVRLLNLPSYILEPSIYTVSINNVAEDQKKEEEADRELQLFEATRLSAMIVCGNGKLDTGEECDDGNINNTDSCTTKCLWAKCGDGFVQKPNRYRLVEECDDGNINNTDSCTIKCLWAKCGDGFVQKPNRYRLVEQCDDGNTLDTDACHNSCLI